MGKWPPLSDNRWSISGASWTGKILLHHITAVTLLHTQKGSMQKDCKQGIISKRFTPSQKQAAN